MNGARDDLLEVIEREKMLLMPELRSSQESVEELLHPEFLEYGASGRVWDRADIVAALQDDPEVNGDGADFSAVTLSPEVVLVTYRITGENGSLRSSVWVHADNRWQLRFHQGTRTT